MSWNDHESPIVGALNHASSEAQELNAVEQWYKTYTKEYRQARVQNLHTRLHDEWVVKCGNPFHAKALEVLGRISGKCTSRCWYDGDKPYEPCRYLKLCNEHGH